jgi:hypothetical protein
MCISALIFFLSNTAWPADAPQSNEGPLDPIADFLRPRVEFLASKARDIFKNFIDDEEEPEDTQNPDVNKVPRTGDPEVGVEPPVIPPQLTVQGMVWGSAIPQVIMNNKILKVGDSIEGAKIVSIDEEGINISFRKKTFKINSPSGPKLNYPEKSREGGVHGK